MNDEAVYRTAPATPGLLNIAGLGRHSVWHCKKLHMDWSEAERRFLKEIYCGFFQAE